MPPPPANESRCFAPFSHCIARPDHIPYASDADRRYLQSGDDALIPINVILKLDLAATKAEETPKLHARSRVHHPTQPAMDQDRNGKENAMSRSLNKVTLIGNVGAEPEVKQTASGTKLAKISVATSRSFNDRSGQRQEKTEWHRVTFWDRMAEIVEQYVHKGDRIYIEGRLEYSQSEDSQGGVRYWTDIVAQEMIMLGGGGRGGDAEYDAAPVRTQRSRQPAAPTPFEDDDDLPF